MKKLLVILGSGSSLGLGLPGVSEIDGLMRGWAAEWLGKRPRFDNYYAAVEAAMHRYVEGCAVTNQHRAINFETVLGNMAALANWVVPSPHGMPLRGLVDDSSGNFGLRFPAGRYGATVAVNDQLTCVMARLARHIRERSRAIDSASAQAKAYARLISSLRHTFDVGIFNLNYDTAALGMWPDAFTGFDNAGHFSPRAVHERQEWNFI